MIDQKAWRRAFGPGLRPQEMGKHGRTERRGGINMSRMARTIRCFALSIAGLLLFTGRNTLSQESLFPDSNLEAAVHEHVYGDEPLTTESVGNLSILQAKKKGIRDLSGLEHATKLALLDLADNEVTDLGPIAGLSYLQSLDLSGNQISDLTPLRGLTRLQYLKLSGNRISDLQPLKGLESLNSLYLARNQIGDLGPLKAVTKLWSLDLEGNRISDLKPLANLTRLSSLNLISNLVSDLSPLAGSREWRSLLLQDNQIQDLEPLVDMAKKDFEGEKRFAPFWHIYLSGNLLTPAARRDQVEQLKGYDVRVQ